MNPISRRSLLSSVAFGAGAYFTPSLTHAAVAAPPRRFLVFTTQHANPYTMWSMRRSGQTDAQDWETNLADLPAADWSMAMAPLYDLRRKLLVLDTLSNPVGVDISDGGGGHYNGPKTVLTGATTTKGAAPKASGGASIDQLIAARVFVDGGIRSLELAQGNPFPFVWSASGQALSPRSAASAFTAVFADRPPPGPTTPPVPPTLTRADKIKAARKQILDFTQARFKRVAGRVSGDDKTRIEAHAALVGDLAARLGGTGGMTPVASAGCFAPRVTSARDMDGAVADMAQLVTAAFACDITRVASIHLGQMSTSDFGAAQVEDVHQDIAHHDEDQTRIGLMGQYYRRHAQQFATLLKSLDSVAEPDGTRLLDNTIVLWVPECGSWIHQMSHLPVIVAGGGGFRMGRYLHWASDAVKPSPMGGNSGDKYAKLGPPIYRLLVSIAQQMGLADVERVGNVDTSLGMSTKGKLDRLT